MAMTTISIEIDENLKVQAEKLFEDRGLNMTSVFRLFVKQMVREQQIPGAIFGEMNRDESRLKAIEKAENVKPELAECLDTGVEEMIESGGSRRYSKGLYRI